MSTPFSKKVEKIAGWRSVGSGVKFSHILHCIPVYMYYNRIMKGVLCMMWVFAGIIVVWLLIGVIAGINAKNGCGSILLGVFMVFVPFIPLIAKMCGMV